ncbi:MerR family transcriptional regulator [Advenella mimigardefordensis]|uniref:Transcriptional regulator, MerR family n=1 Tax=Advenella mimigardefordensis (strain DSM 17166 / LMG 22922 / DPN7) TaxID=1247726 RepID=W0P6E5_ADVMD|nr:MerR family DNA-binding transcriptional regulator [Advenella mimigardefordensis]AHG62434.1 transcriptional regulator, MerR family [Advenella mimigardefordensis DPN7]
MNPRTWTISELAEEFNITPRTLRFYEDHRIVNPIRDGQKRIYTHRDRARLKLALRGKRLGLQLSEICSLIGMYEGPGSTQPQLQSYLTILTRHKQQLMQQKQDLDQTLAEIDEQEKNCLKLLGELDSTATPR